MSLLSFTLRIAGSTLAGCAIMAVAWGFDGLPWYPRGGFKWPMGAPGAGEGSGGVGGPLVSPADPELAAQWRLEQQRRYAQAIELAREADESFAAFEERFGRFLVEWERTTGVAIDDLATGAILPEPVRGLLADPAGKAAAECWDRLSTQRFAYRERVAIKARFDVVAKRLEAGSMRATDPEFVASTAQTVQGWLVELDGHERCLTHIRDLLRVWSIDPPSSDRPSSSGDPP